MRVACWIDPKVADRSTPLKKRIFDLRVSHDHGVEALQFSLNTRTEPSIQPGDRLTLTYRVNQNSSKELAHIWNASTQRQVYIASESEQYFQMAAMGAGLAAFLILLGFGMPKWSALAVPTVALSGGIIATKVRTSGERDRQTIARLSSEQELLERQTSCEKRLSDLESEKRTNTELASRLISLCTQMRENRDEIYSHRIDVFTRAVKGLKEECALIQNLISKYESIIQMIRIEHETFKLSEEFPNDLGYVDLKYQELQNLEDQKHEMEAQINLLGICKGNADDSLSLSDKLE